MKNRELPKVGDLIRVNYGLDNPNTWPHWGEVILIVDENFIVIKRITGYGNTTIEIFDKEYWNFNDAFEHQIKIRE